jgi:hypothetical protein
MLEESCFSEPTMKYNDQRSVTRTHHNGPQDREAIRLEDSMQLLGAPGQVERVVDVVQKHEQIEQELVWTV